MKQVTHKGVKIYQLISGKWSFKIDGVTNYERTLSLAKKTIDFYKG